MKPLSKSSEKNHIKAQEAEKQDGGNYWEEVKIRYRIINLNNRFIISTSADSVRVMNRPIHYHD